MRFDGYARKKLLESEAPDILLMSPVWSPDATKVAFSRGLYFRAGEHLSAQIGIMNADGSGIHYIEQAGSNCGFPSWSPDGKSLVYKQNDHLVVFDLSSGQKRNLTSPAAQHDNFPFWSPKGGWIVFTSDRESDENFKIYLIRPDGTELYKLTNSSGNSHASWSPDGK